MPHGKQSASAAKGFLVIAGFLLAFALGELLLQLIFINKKFSVWPPHQNVIFQTSESMTPGIHGPQRFTTNSEGIRGDEFSPKDTYRIMAIGGSTTECLFLDQNAAWPAQIQTNIREKGYPLWVGNAGVSGHSTRKHVVDFERLLKRYPFIDAVVFLVGVNDFLGFISWHEKKGQAFYKKSGYWKLGGKIKRRFFSGKEKNRLLNRQNELQYDLWRQNRLNASTLLNELPDLTSEIQKYKNRLNQLIDIAESYSVRLIFLTQPSLWREDLSPEQAKILWMGWANGSQSTASDYYSVSALASGMKQMNEALLQVCRERNIECIDLANQLPKNTTVFYDDIHFNLEGATQVANIITDHLLKFNPDALLRGKQTQSQSSR